MILYDGWPLLHAPNSPAALHLTALLENHPADLPAAVAFPTAAVDAAAPGLALPAGIQALTLPAGATLPDRLRWEQRLLPQMARHLGARLLHLVGGAPPLWGGPPAVVSPAGVGALSGERSAPEPHSGVRSRLRAALAQGGLERSRALLWPADLPAPAVSIPVLRLPPVAPRAFLETPAPAGRSRLGLPETYLLYHGPHNPIALHQLLEAWSWAAASLGEYYPLVVLGLDDPARTLLANMMAETGLAGSVLPWPAVSLPDLAAIYRGSSALFHPASLSPWGSAVRLALWSGLPVVALETAWADAVLGPAAYLVPPGAEGTPQETGRLLGAALITVVVEESVAGQLTRAAQQRAAAWRSANFPRELATAYRRLLESLEP